MDKLNENGGIKLKEKILIVENDRDIVRILERALARESYLVRANPNGNQVEAEIANFKPDLILLDIMLNDIDGFTICKNIVHFKIPIIMITARVDIMDKIVGLEIGADDYITKPFDIREVISRVRVALRRNKDRISNNEEILEINNISINVSARIVQSENQVIRLKPKEFDLLVILAKNINRVYSREQLLDLVWGYDFLGDRRTVDVHITRIRRKLDKNIIIETIFGVGYVLRVGKEI